ncbi:hypothetical protein ACIBCT_24840 [Streptosporangium sp. NPDC050855]|uniref:hypothetical protein n=1 Tax=Streptosporangium sp. NPDC050855 TaxID=3366194 RepID=UPI00378BD249
MVHLNGAHADRSHWRRIIAGLGSDYRHITYDERPVRDPVTGTSHRSLFTSEKGRS